MKEREMQKSPLHNEEVVNPSTTTNQFAMLRLQSPNSLPSTTTTTTNDFDKPVIFTDPCSMCGTKKRHMTLSPLHNYHHHHHHQDYSFTPRKKLFFSYEPSSNNNNNSSPSSIQTPIPLFQPQKQIPTPDLTRSNSAPLPSFEKNKKSNCPQSPSSNLGYSGSFAGSSGGASPTTASRPPCVPVLLRSISDPTPRSSLGKGTSLEKNVGGDVVGAPVGCSDSERRTKGESSAEKRWKRMRGCLAEMNNCWKDILVEQDKEEEEEEEEVKIEVEDTNNDTTKNKEVCEIGTDGNVEREEDGDGCLRVSCKCSCGKSYQLVVTIVPEAE